VKRVFEHCEGQGEEEAVLEDEAAFSGEEAVITLLFELLPKVRKLIAEYRRWAKEGACCTSPYAADITRAPLGLRCQNTGSFC
jgi:hypothetical protein